MNLLELISPTLQCTKTGKEYKLSDIPLLLHRLKEAEAVIDEYEDVIKDEGFSISKKHSDYRIKYPKDDPKISITSGRHCLSCNMSYKNCRCKPFTDDVDPSARD